MKVVVEMDERDYNTMKNGFLVVGVTKGKPLDSVLCEIRAEIENLPSELTYDGRRMIRRVRVYDILDKYKAESGDEE